MDSCLVEKGGGRGSEERFNVRDIGYDFFLFVFHLFCIFARIFVA